MGIKTLTYIHQLLRSDLAAKKAAYASENKKWRDWYENGDGKEYPGQKALDEAVEAERKSRYALEEFENKEWN